MFVFVVTLAIIVAILLILVVLIQNPKGGGISASFSAANQIAGVKRTNDFIEKATWTLAIALLVLSISSGYLHNTGDQQESKVEQAVQEDPVNPFNAGGDQVPAGDMEAVPAE